MAENGNDLSMEEFEVATTEAEVCDELRAQMVVLAQQFIPADEGAGAGASLQASIFKLPEELLPQEVVQDPGFDLLVRFPSNAPLYYIYKDMRRACWIVQFRRRPVEVGISVVGDVLIGGNHVQLRNSLTYEVGDQGVGACTTLRNYEGVSFFSERHPKSAAMIDVNNRARLDLSVYRQNYQLIPGRTILHVSLCYRFSYNEEGHFHSLANLDILSRHRDGRDGIPESHIQAFQQNETDVNLAMGPRYPQRSPQKGNHWNDRT